MIKSKLNTVGFWMTPIMVVIIIGILTFMLIYDTLDKDRIIVSIGGFVFLVLTISQLFATSKLITIDPINKKIIVDHYITRLTKIYDFADIDGYADIIERPARGRSFRVIYIVQTEKFVLKISSFIYSNIEDIEVGLKSTKYLGQKEYSYFKNIKILFGRKVLND